MKKYKLIAHTSLALLILAGTTNSQASTDVKTALKDVGIAALPSFLDAATKNITIKFSPEF